MKTYHVYFRTEHQWALRDFEAKTPEQALAEARRFADERHLELDFEDFSGFDAQINEIEVCDPEDNTLADWQDDDLRLRLSASELLEAAERVVAHWERGDLASAVRDLAAVISKAKG